MFRCLFFTHANFYGPNGCSSLHTEVGSPTGGGRNSLSGYFSALLGSLSQFPFPGDATWIKRFDFVWCIRVKDVKAQTTGWGETASDCPSSVWRERLMGAHSSAAAGHASGLQCCSQTYLRDTMWIWNWLKCIAAQISAVSGFTLKSHLLQILRLTPCKTKLQF